MTVRPLLKQLQALYRQHAQVEYQIAEVERAIIATDKGTTRPRRPRPKPAEAVEPAREIIRVLREAGEPLPRREIASRLGLTPKAVTRRLQTAVAAGLVERAGGALYRVSKVVPTF